MLAVAGVWLLFVTSQGDHGLAHVQPWAAERLATLGACVGLAVAVAAYRGQYVIEGQFGRFNCL